MMHRKTIVLSMIVALCASVLVLTGGQCGAQEPGPNYFERLDANADGRLTKDELPEQMAEKIMQADADGDGEVTKEELEAAREKMGGRRGGQGQGGPNQAGRGQGGPQDGAFFERLDANKDGKLTKDELPERATERIMQADADGDGIVTKAEFAAAREKMGGQRGEGQGEGGGRDQRGAQGQGGPDAGAFFDRLDANKDGKLTKDELPERAAERIMQADADGDGAVTKAEFAVAREKMGGQRGEGQGEGGGRGRRGGQGEGGRNGRGGTDI